MHDTTPLITLWNTIIMYVESSLIMVASLNYNIRDPLCFSYELVRLLQRRVHGSVGRLIDTKLEEKVLEGDGHSVVAQITEDVLNSAE